MKIHQDNHYLAAVLLVHGLLNPRKIKGTQLSLEQLNTTINNVKTALYKAEKK